MIQTKTCINVYSDMNTWIDFCIVIGAYEDFDEDNSYHEDYFAVVAWKDELYRYFEVVKQNEKEVIR